MYKNLSLKIIFVLLLLHSQFIIADSFNNSSTKSWHQNITLADGRTIEALPAEYETIEITQIVQPAQVIEKQIPAKTKQVKRQIIRSPASTVERIVPAVTTLSKRRVIDTPARKRVKTIPQVTKTIVGIDPRTGLQTKMVFVVQPEYKEYEVIPATYKEIEEQIVVAEASVQQIVVPAQYETVTETVVISAASIEKEVVPAVTKKVKEIIEIKPARLVLKNENGAIVHIFVNEAELRRFQENPLDPEFVYSKNVLQQVTETIVVKPAQTEYISIPAKVDRVNEYVLVKEAATEIVTTPATFKAVTERVLVHPATVDFVHIPARFETETKIVVVSPARGEKTAVTKAIEVKKLVAPAQVVERSIPATYKTVTRRVVNSPEQKMERTIPAQTKMQTRTIVKVPEQVGSREVPAETVTITRWVSQQEPDAILTSNLIFEKFEWPTTNTMVVFDPPKTNIKIDIPNATCGYTQNQNTASLMDVFDNFSSLLTKYKYQKRVFKYKHGFAILTSPERISEKAENILDPSSNTRIKLDQHPINGIGKYLEILFTKPSTRYRYLAFIITANDNVQGTNNEATPEGLKAVFKAGGVDSDLPTSMRDYAFTSEYKCQVWVYEFSRIDRDDPSIMKGDLFVPASPTLSEFAHRDGSPALKALFETSTK
jgi:hypothetical protein